MQLVTRKLSFVALFAVATLAFTSCMRNNNDDQPQIPAAGLMAFNLSPDQDGMQIRLSGNPLGNQPLGFSNFTGGYLPIYTGARDIRAINQINGAELTSTAGFTFDADKYYSLFVTGADSNYTNIIVNDHLDTLLPASGEALVRYIQAIPDSNAYAVKLVSGGKEVPTNAAFNTVSEFASMPTGELAITANNNNGVSLSRTITLEASKAYTILLIGHPTATDDTKKPQIKFIVNGTVTNDQPGS